MVSVFHNIYPFLYRVFRLTRELFTRTETSPLPVNTRHSWSLSSEGSLPCHTYTDTGHPFIMVISTYPCHLHLFPRVKQWSYHYLFLRLRSVAAGFHSATMCTHRSIYIQFIRSYYQVKYGKRNASVNIHLIWIVLKPDEMYITFSIV